MTSSCEPRFDELGTPQGAPSNLVFVYPGFETVTGVVLNYQSLTAVSPPSGITSLLSSTSMTKSSGQSCRSILQLPPEGPEEGESTKEEPLVTERPLPVMTCFDLRPNSS